MVLARKTGRASSFGEAGDCGKTCLENSLHLRNLAVNYLDAGNLCLSVRLRIGRYKALCVFTRERNGMVLDARMVKLLIRSTFTSPNGDFKPVYGRHPIWG